MSIQCNVCLHENADGTITCEACGSPLTSMESTTNQAGYHLPSGTILVNSYNQNQYRIEKTLGEGGFGITYKGIYVKNSLPVAIKENWPQGGRNGTIVIWPSSITPQEKREQINRFIREGEYIYKCQHPHIVQVYDWFVANDTAYIVMQFLSGKSLEQLLKEEGGILAESKVKKYLIQVCKGLKLVHANNLLHRDIKPDNIMLESADKAVLIDFGNAREFIAGKTGDMTRILTPGYAPPEQYSLTGRRSSALDIYSLCATMYKLLTGKEPAEAGERTSQLSSSAPDPLIPPRQIVPSLDPILEQLILSGMKMNSQERIQSVDEIIAGLQGKFVPPALTKARQLVAAQKLTEAVQAYQQCLQERENEDAAVELAMVQMHLNSQDLEQNAQQAINISPSDGRGYGILGLLQCRRSNWQQALPNLQTAVRLSPGESWIQANLAWALVKLDQWQEAQQVIDKVISLQNNSSFALGLKAWIAASRKQWKEAMFSATKAISNTKNSTSNSQQILSWVYPCYLMGFEYGDIIQRAASFLEQRLQEFMTKVPNSAFPYGFKGWKQAQQKSWSQALANFQQALNKPPIPRWILLNQAIAKEHLNDLQGAIATYQLYQQKFSENNSVLLNINQSSIPDFAFIYFRLGTLLGKTRKWKEAQKYLQKALKCYPKYPEAYHNLGWVLLNIKNQEGELENSRELLSAYQEAIQLYQQQQKFNEAQKINNCFQLAGINF